jgi:hypothetical protein
MSEETEALTKEDVEGGVQQIAVGLSPLGGVGINITSAKGEQAGAVISIEEAEQLAGRLQNLAGILLQAGYMAMAQERMQAEQLAQKLGVNGKGVWTPGS